MLFIRVLVFLGILLGTVSSHSINNHDDKLHGIWRLEQDSFVFLVIRDDNYCFIGKGKAYDSVVGYFGDKRGKIDLAKASEVSNTYQADNFVIHIDEGSMLVLTKQAYTSFCYLFRRELGL